MADKKVSEGKTGLFKSGSKLMYTVITVGIVVLLMVTSFFGYTGLSLITKDNEAQIDMTSAKIFTMDDETTAFIKSIDKDVQIIVLENETDYGANLSQQNEVIKNYHQLNSEHIEIIYADPTTNPTYLNKYSYDNAELGDVIVACGVRYTIVQSEKLYSDSTDSNTGLTIEYSKAADAMNSALMFVVSDDIYTVGFITGHNEELSTEFADFLNNNVYVTKTVNLKSADLDLSEFDILICNGATGDFLDEELKKLDDFLYNKGEFSTSFVYFAAYEKQATPKLDAFLEEYGLKVTDDIIYERNSDRYYLGSPLATYVEVPSSESSYDNPLADKTAITDYFLISPYTRAIKTVSPKSNIPSAVVSTRVILGCYNDTAAVTSVELAGSASFTINDNDPIDDYAAAATATITYEGYASRIVVFGSNQMVADAMLDSPSVVNNEYIIHLFGNWVKRDNVYPYVAPTNLTGEVFTPSDSVALVLLVVLVILPIAAVIVVGITVYVRRRHS